MPPALPGSADANNTYEDMSGITTKPNVSISTGNPYDVLIEKCDHDSSQIQALYSRHREARNAQQKDKMLSADFPGLNLDELLRKLEDPSIEPGFEDPRNCLVFWVRPPQHVKDIVSLIQQRLLAVSPNLWLMPLSNLHMTALEITHSLTAPEIHSLVETMQPIIPTMCNYLLDHHAPLVKPILSYDSSALALSFLPDERQSYTYHHVRRDLYDLATGDYTDPKVKIESRYVVPSAHITLARFISSDDHASQEAMKAWFDEIEAINSWLQDTHWTNNSFRWIVGEEKGIDCRQGALWYGGGSSIFLGRGS